MLLEEKFRTDLANRRDKIISAGGTDKIEERHEKGLLTARERLIALFQPDTFQEFGTFIRHSTAFGMGDKDLPADGVIVGTGYVGGRQVAAFSQDFTVVAGTLGKMHARKMCQALDYALKNGTPVVAFKDSGGARIQEGVDSLSGYGDVFYRNVLLSGVVPQIAIIAGPCAGGASYSPALMDWIIMTRHNAQMFITGPQVIKAVTGRDVSMDDVGGAEMHASVSGNVHFIAEDDRDMPSLTPRLLTFCRATTPRIRRTISLRRRALTDEGMNDPRPVRPVGADGHARHHRRLVDNGDFLEVHALFASNLIVGFARIEGVVVGIIANNSMQKAGARHRLLRQGRTVHPLLQ